MVEFAAAQEEAQSSNEQQEAQMQSDENQRFEEQSEAMGKTQEESINANAWTYDGTIAGEGDKPDYLLDKFKGNMSEQAKAYVELQKKLGSQVKAPDEYKFEEGLSLDTADPNVVEFLSISKEANISQDTMNKIMQVYGKHLQNLGPKSAEQVMSTFNDQDKQDFQKVSNWARSNLNADEVSVLGSMVTSADQLRVLNKIRQFTNNNFPSPDTFTTQPSQSEETLMQEFQDNYDKYMNNSQYRDDWQKRMGQLLEEN